MAGVTAKQQLKVIDGTPKKRVFLSIISDYDLRTGLCELVDNALDLWLTNEKKSSLSIAIILDPARQIISVRDNAGGVPPAQLEFLIAPGASRNDPTHELIGIFGVGGKRAGVALGERVEIRTRAKGEKSLQLDITSAWLETEDWSLAAYEIPDIEAETTTVEITKLRQTFDEDDVEEIRTHLGETYKWYIDQGCEISLNAVPVVPVSYDAWAYPTGFPPRISNFSISPAEGKNLQVTLTAGLIADRDPELENYGVYFYCNNRLIVKALRTREVGYWVKSEAGVPHPDASLCRVVVELHGGAELMPWNSSKNGLNYSHPAFTQIAGSIVAMTTYYSSLSRRMKNDWDDQVFNKTSGSMEIIDPAEMLSPKKIVLPALPRVRLLPYLDRLRDSNKSKIAKQPWILGLIESMGLVDIISKQHADTKNRAALILLDSNFEISLKEFIVNRADLFPPHVYNDAKILNLFKARHTVINEVKVHVTFPPTLLAKVQHFYNLRNKLIHERATVGILDSQVADYRTTIEQVLKFLFKINFPAR